MEFPLTAFDSDCCSLCCSAFGSDFGSDAGTSGKEGLAGKTDSAFACSSSILDALGGKSGGGGGGEDSSFTSTVLLDATRFCMFKSRVDLASVLAIVTFGTCMTGLVSFTSTFMFFSRCFLIDFSCFLYILSKIYRPCKKNF